MLKYILYSSLLLNCVTFLAFALDKRRSRLGKARISEANLLWMSWATGMVGAWLGIWAFHHKNRKTSFKIKLMLATIANLMWVLLWLALAPET